MMQLGSIHPKKASKHGQRSKGDGFMVFVFVYNSTQPHNPKYSPSVSGPQLACRRMTGLTMAAQKPNK